jgi:hypothetical protein
MALSRQAVVQRWRALDTAAKATWLALALLLAGALAVRIWLIVGYGPAFVGFPDSHEYVTAATVGVFHDVQKPAGYPIFLELAHLLSDGLTFTIVLQHALGIASGVLLFAAVRRTGAPAWLGLFPAAVVFFGGTGLLLEHSLLGDTAFTFLQALGVYAAVRVLAAGGLRWALVAGVAAGASFWVKTDGLSSVVLIPCVLLAGAHNASPPASSLEGDVRRGLVPDLRRRLTRDLRRRLAPGAAAAAAAAALVVGYPAVQALVTGYWGYERQDAWNLYGRVATFVDCPRFTPPAGTRFLCPAPPPSHRLSESFYQYSPTAPAVARFGGPAHAPASANGLLERFSLAAIEHQPLAYAGAIARSLAFYLSPRPGEGYTPAGIREALLEAKGVRAIEPALAAYYPHARGYSGSAHATAALDDYERHTRIEGPLLYVMLIAAIAGAPLLPRRRRHAGRPRAASLLFTLTALCSVALAAAGNSYDARYGYPAFGPLAAGAALGAWAIAARLRQVGGRLGRPRGHPGRARRKLTRAGSRRGTAGRAFSARGTATLRRSAPRALPARSAPGERAPRESPRNAAS